MAQWVKDPLLWLGSLLWGGFDPWSRNVCMPQAAKKRSESILNH